MHPHGPRDRFRDGQNAAFVANDFANLSLKKNISGESAGWAIMCECQHCDAKPFVSQIEGELSFCLSGDAISGMIQRVG